MWFWFMCFLFTLSIGWGYAQDKSSETQDDFFYDSKGKKDPFLPGEPVWTAARTATRLRESFLDGVIWDNNQSLAIVDGKVLKKGDAYLGAIVQTIEKDRAVFLAGQESITVLVAPSKEGNEGNEK